MESTENNFDAQRPASSFKPNDLSMKDFPHPMAPITLAIRQRYRYTLQLFDELQRLHRLVLVTEEEVVESPSARVTTSIFQYHLHSENWVFQMRRTLDSLVQYASIYIKGDPNVPVGRVETGGLSTLLRCDGKTHSVFPVIMGDGTSYASDTTGFCVALNDLFNGMKHHAAHEESHSLICAEVPSVVSFYAKNNDYQGGITYQNHNAFHLIMGFQDCVARILSNIRKTSTTENLS